MRRLTVAALALAAATGLSVASCSSGPPTPSDPVLARGQQVYAANCAACHGSSGEGAVGPRLIGIASTMSEDKQIATVTNGVKGSSMPAWKDRLSPEDIKAVVAYTRQSLS